MKRRLLFLLPLILLGGPCALAFPPVSEEILLDHGFRYHIGHDEINGCAMAIAGEMLLLSQSTMATYTAPRGIRRGLQGEEADIDYQKVVDYGDRYDVHAISDVDSLGWKVACAVAMDDHEPMGLHIHNLDPVTMERTLGPVTIMPPGSRHPNDCAIAFNGTVHVVLWLEDHYLRMARVLPDLTILDPGGILLANSVTRRSISLDLSPAGGLVAWIRNGMVMVRRLDVTGLPLGDAQSLATLEGAALEPTCVCQLGENWLVTWAPGWWSGDSGPQYARLDLQGQLLSPGIVTLPPLLYGEPTIDVAASASQDMGWIAWRGGLGPLVAVRISADGILIDHEPIVVSESSVYEYQDWWDEWLSRNLACLWTGQHFVTMWSTWWWPYGVEKHQKHDSRFPLQEGRTTAPGIRDRSVSYPVYAQWTSPDGSNLFENEVKINQGSKPSSTRVGHAADNFLAIIADGGSRSHLHVVNLDAYGNLVRDPSRFSARLGFAGHESRPWEGGVVIAHGGSWTDEYGTDSYVYATFLDEDGLRVARNSIYLGYNENMHYVAGWDVAPIGDWGLIAYEGYRWGEPHYVKVGEEWAVVPTSGDWAVAPSIVMTDGGHLLAWVEIFSNDYRIFTATLDPDMPDVTGIPLWGMPSDQQKPYLVKGPDQILCVFVMRLPGSETGDDIYAMRFQANGAPLDEEPILVSNMPTTLAHPRAVWDGFHYMISWTAPDMDYAHYARRMTAAGEIVDDEDTLVGVGGRYYSPVGRLASDGAGHVILGYAGGRVRIIYDLPPASGDHTSRSLTPNLILNGAPYPNPTSGQISFRLGNAVDPDGRAEVLDLQGRRVLSLGSYCPADGSVIAWDGKLADGRRAPAGVYYLRVVTEGQSATRRFVIVP
jgi:hypothetical protein